MFTAVETADELRALLAHVDAGSLRSVIDCRHPLVETAAALQYVSTGHAKAKVLIDMSGHET